MIEIISPVPCHARDASDELLKFHQNFCIISAAIKNSYHSFIIHKILILAWVQVWLMVADGKLKFL